MNNDKEKRRTEQFIKKKTENKKNIAVNWIRTLSFSIKNNFNNV